MCNDTVELLKECNAGCKMAMSSMDQVSKHIHEKSLKETVDKYYQKHKELTLKTEDLLSRHQAEEEERPLTQGYSRMMTALKMAMEDDSHQIAKIMMDGCTMGIQSISEYLNKYENASSDSRSLAKDIIRSEEAFVQELKAYL